MSSRAAVLAARSYGAFRSKLAAFDCRGCGLCTGRTMLVVDRGAPGASIFLVGEGPGAEEDRTGQAFVGRSGRLLDQMLREAGIEPTTEVLIANVVKCRPPGNRAPTREEAETCMPYLRRQLELARPRIVGLLGATAAKHILGAAAVKGLSALVGRALRAPDFPGAMLLPLFHPAYILRNPSRRRDMVAHLKLLAEAR
jgi:DNA polymerase